MSRRHTHGTPESPKAATPGKAERSAGTPHDKETLVHDGLSRLLASVEGRRILIVEDEILVAGELADEIEEVGGEVIGPVYNVPDALRISADGGFDAAILDINLHGKEIFPVSDLLVRRGIPFIFHTGTVKGPVALKLYDGVPVISKPSLTVDLLKALVSVLKD